MSHLNDTSMSPQGVEGAYPGLQNPTTSNSVIQPDFTSEEKQKEEAALSATTEKTDVIEGAKGIIEGTELAPLGDGKVASDPGLVSQAQSLAQKAYQAVVGEGK